MAFFTRAFSGRALAAAAAATGCGAYAYNSTVLRSMSMIPTATADAEDGPFSPKEWRDFKLMARTDISPNTAIYKFELPDKTAVAGLPVASCVLTGAKIGKVKDDGSKGMIIRPYTPTSEVSAEGHFDLIVKEYPEGKMSKHIASLKVGDSLAFKGPFVKLPYEPNMKKEIGMIAGGTGITPMYQVIREILNNENDNTKISLVFANVTDKDILLKSELDGLAAKHPNFSVYYVLDKPGWFWKGGSGYITKEMVQKHIPGPAADSLVMVCGPPPMMNCISGDKNPDKSQGEVSGLLKDLGYTADMVYKF